MKKKQTLENLPDEILSQPRFFPVYANKDPATKAWNRRKNQQLYTQATQQTGLAGFDTCGHERGDDYLLIDFDHVLDDDGKFVSSEAERWFNYIQQSFDSYCERSISGNGIHILARPTPGKFKKIINTLGKGVIPFADSPVKGSKLELFYRQAARYCFLTGELFNTQNKSIASGEVVDEVLTQLLRFAETFAPKKKTPARQSASDTDRKRELPTGIRELVDQINSITDEQLTAKGYLQHSVNGAPAPLGYICPWCLSGTHKHKTGALQFYTEPNNNHVHCHAQQCHGDIIALLAKIYDMQTDGKDFFVLIRRAADDFAVTYDPKIFDYSPPAQADDDASRTTQDQLPDCPIALRVPAGFSLDQSGIWCKLPAKKQGGEPILVKVANTPILPTKIFCTLDHGGYSYEIAIRRDEQWHYATFDGRTLQDPRRVIDIGNDGASILAPKLLAKFFAHAIVDPALPKTTVYNQPGWQKDGTFVDPCGGIDSTGTAYICKRSGVDYDEMFSACGDVEQWKQKLRDVISGHQGRLKRIIIGAALTAPLLKLLHLPNFWLHIQGTRNSAKTAILKFAQSIFGNPDEGYLLRTFDSSPKNRVAMAAALNDLPQAIDELETLSPKERAEIEKSVYDFVSGVDGQRNKKNGDVREAVHFRGIRLSTGESPLLSSTAKGGAYKRAIQLHVDSPLFDNKEARNLHIFCADHHGHYRKPWIDYIRANTDAIKTDFVKVLDRIDEEGIFTDYTQVPAEIVEETYIRAIAACAVAFFRFHCCLGLSDKFDTVTATQDAQSILGNLPTKAETSDLNRAIDALASWVNEHPRNFMRYGNKTDITDFAPSFTETSGIVFADGRVAFYPNAFRRICDDELKLPSYQKFLDDLYDDDKIDAPNRREKAKQMKICGQNKRFYLFKPGVLADDPTQDDATEPDYDDAYSYYDK